MMKAAGQNDQSDQFPAGGSGQEPGEAAAGCGKNGGTETGAGRPADRRTGPPAAGRQSAAHVSGAGFSGRDWQTRRIESRVAAADAGGTLLDWLCSRFLYCGRTEWRQQLEAGNLCVSGKVAPAEQLLQAGDLVTFTPPADLEPPVPDNWRILHELDGILVVDKPALLPVHPSGRYYCHTLWYRLKAQYPELHIITRLDRETSGLLLAACTSTAAALLRAQQAEGGIEKDYTAWVHGRFAPDRLPLRLEGWLLADENSAVRKKRRFVREDPQRADSQSCLTEVLAVQHLQRDGRWYSRLDLRLYTGRTHQIRATLYSLGYPLLGDKLYGQDDGMFIRFGKDMLNAADLGRLEIPHQALQCRHLAFRAADGRRIELELPPLWPWTDKAAPDQRSDGGS